MGREEIDTGQDVESVEYDEEADVRQQKEKAAGRRKGRRGATDAVDNDKIEVHLYRKYTDTVRWLKKSWDWEELPDKLIALGKMAMDAGARDKFDLPVWLPVSTLEDIGRKRMMDIEEVTVLALDFDSEKGRPATLEEVQELFTAWNGWAYTSWSHAQHSPRVRAVIQLDGRLSPVQYGRVWHWAERRCHAAGLVLDNHRKNANSLWFSPAPKPGFHEVRWKGVDGKLPTQLILTNSYRHVEQGVEQGAEFIDSDIVVDAADGRFSIATWAAKVKPGDKVKIACPFVPDSTVGSAFLRRRAAGVLFVCTSPNHGHASPYKRWWQDLRSGFALRAPDQTLLDRLEWRLDKEGRRVAVKSSLHNCQLILTEDVRWKDRVWYDKFAECKRVDDRRIEKHEVWAVRLWLEQVYGIEIHQDIVAGALTITAMKQTRDPLLEYLEKLRWDSTPRINTWLQRAFGATDDALHREIGRKFLLQLVARAYEPGCKADYVMVLVGDQGEGKGKALRALAGDGWFSDTLFDVRHKDAYQQLKGVWLYEFAELASIRGHSTIEQVKSYLTSSTDRYRKSYGEDSQPHPRRTVFVGTTNEDAFLYDATGNRRYWPVEIRCADDKWVRDHRDQLLAEAVEAYKKGELRYFSDDAYSGILKTHTAKFEVHEVLAEPILSWVTKTGFQAVTAADVMEHALEMPRHRFDRATETRIGTAFRRDLNWKKTRIRTKKIDVYVFYDPVLTADQARTKYQQRLSYKKAGETVDASALPDLDEGDLVS